MAKLTPYEATKAGDIATLKSYKKDYLLQLTKPYHHKEFITPWPNREDILPLTVIACIHRQNEALEYLISVGADPKYMDHTGHTLLHYACRYGSLEIAEYLVSLGLNPEQRDQYQHTPFIEACSSGHLQVAAFIASLKEVDTAALNNIGWTPFYSACHFGELDTVKFLVSTGANSKLKSSVGESPFAAACSWQRWDVAKYLISIGEYDNEAGGGLGSTPLGDICKKGNLELAQLLAPKVANIEKLGAGLTPFYWACYSNNIELVKYLYSLKANIDEPQDSSPLLLACIRGHTELACYLHSIGANIHSGSESGMTPLSVAQDCNPALAAVFTGSAPVEQGAVVYQVTEDGVGSASAAEHDAIVILGEEVEISCKL